MNKEQFDDIVTDCDGSIWSQVCGECIVRIGLEEITLSVCGSGICGVNGCNNEAVFYVDFD